MFVPLFAVCFFLNCDKRLFNFNGNIILNMLNFSEIRINGINHEKPKTQAQTNVFDSAYIFGIKFENQSEGENSIKLYLSDQNYIEGKACIARMLNTY